jgi:hypothetical protein
MTTSRRRPLASRYTADPALIHMANAGNQFAGEHQYALAYLFSKAQVDVDLTDAHKPVIGNAQMGPVAVVDGLCRDYALLPEQLTMLSRAFGICRVVDRFPACEGCCGDAHFDLWPSHFGTPSLFCHDCAAFAYGVALGAGTATCLVTFNELPAAVR